MNKFFLALFLGFFVSFIFSLPSFASDVNPLFPENLPHALPWDDGTTVWNDWIAFKTSTGWGLIYHNSDFYADSDGFLVSSPALELSHNYFFTGDNGTTWSSSTSNHFVSPMFFDTTLSSPPCKEKLYASNTIFAVGDRDAASYCTDVIPYEFGDSVFHRINLMSDNYTFLSSTADPAPEQIINSATDDFVDVPSPVTDPAGFVSALFVNFGIWIRNLIVPDSDFFSSRFNAIQVIAQEHFPIFFSISDIVSGSTAVDSSVSLGSVSFGSSSTAPLVFFSPSSWSPDTFAGLRSFLSMLMYVWLAYFVTTKLSRIFSS